MWPEVFFLKFGASGFEPLTSWSQARRANQTALRPVQPTLPRSVANLLPIDPQGFEDAFEIVVRVEAEDDLAFVLVF